jgi:branched-chain amino acid transport system substrate-binding protein
LTVVSESYATTDLDLTAPMQRIAEARPDAVAFGALLPNSAALIMEARYKVGMQVPFYGDPALTADLAALVPPDRLKGVSVGHVKISFYVPPEKRSPLYTRFLDGVRKTGPVDGILQSPGYGWDAMQVLQIAYKQAGSTDPDKVKSAMENLRLPPERERSFVVFNSFHFSATDHFNNDVSPDDFAVQPIGPRVDGTYKLP